MSSDHKSSSANLARSLRKSNAAVDHLSRTSEEELGQDGTLNGHMGLAMDRMDGSTSTRGVRVERTFEVHSLVKMKSTDLEDIF